ncbi:MAG: GNAT family N-acetyltransferase [bacterium]
MLTIEKITRFEDFLKLEDEWNMVLGQSEANIIFLSFEFLKAEWECLGWGNPLPKNFNVFILLVKENDKIKGILPLVKYKTTFSGFPIKKIRILGKLSMRRGIIITEQYEEVITAMLKYLINTEREWDIIEFIQILKESRCTKFIEDISKKNGLGYFLIDSQTSPYIEINKDWEEYFRGRSKNFHKSLNNKINKLNQTGNFEYREYHTLEEIGEALPIIFEIDLKSWKGKEGTAISSSEESKRFFTLLSKYFAQRDGISIWILWLNDIPIAFEYHLIYNKIVYSLKWSYDEEYHAFSPGLVLKRISSEYFFKKGFKEIDLLGRADSFKLKWTDKTRQHCTIYISNRNCYSKLIYNFEFKFKQWIKKSNYLYQIYQRIKKK